MVRFAPHVARLILVRENSPDYAGGRVSDVTAETSGPETAADAPLPDPFNDADSLEELEEEITILAAHIHAATHRLLTLLADFDRRRGWELGGHRTCAHWLHVRTGIDRGFGA